MKYEEVSWYSDRLNREMCDKIYGYYGPAFIFQTRIAFTFGQSCYIKCLFIDKVL